MIPRTHLGDSSTEGVYHFRVLFATHPRATKRTLAHRKQRACIPSSSRPIRTHMSDIICNDAAQPRWRQLCNVAVLELDTEKLPGRIDEARTAVLDRIENGVQNLSEGERFALHDAL